MRLKLVKGRFDKDDAVELLTQLIQVKIKFHENKIQNSQHEEDIKMREQRIKQLQKDFDEARQLILAGEKSFDLESEILIN